jgi:hypothetical protein
MKPCLSVGRIAGIDGAHLHYDADTLPGSAGGPIFDQEWRVIGMHVLADAPRRVNVGLTRASMLDAIKTSSAWYQIAEQHRLANVSAARQAPKPAVRDRPRVPVAAGVPPPTETAKAGETELPAHEGAVLLRAAVSSSFDPAALSEDDAARLRAMVVDSSNPRWVLRPAERERIIRSATSVAQLRSQQDAASDGDPAQQSIDRILAGPPYDLDEMPEDVLSWWIQAVGWFGPVISGLPTPAEVTRVLERKRARSRLVRIAGPGFKRREKELKRLLDWFRSSSGPLSLTGIGGIGKSALVARFVSQLPHHSLVLWLDFDRADLAPDDAISVLSAIAQQAAVALDGFEVPVFAQASDWKAGARELGRTLARLVTDASAPLLVLDSFEAAQYAERYQELWPLLEARSEVRTATLQLLTRDRPDLVKAVDERAATWYASTQDVSKPEIAAELVYHRLRLGDLAGAKAAWREGMGKYLLEAIDELPDEAARTWLRERLAAVPVSEQSLEAWELQAEGRIRDARSRGLYRAVPGILRERSDRSVASPLIFHEGVELRQNGERDAAVALLERSRWENMHGAAGRNCRVLRALLACDAGQRHLAEKALRPLTDESNWTDRINPKLDALMMLAARIRLTVDLERERMLLRQIRESKLNTALRRVLSPVDAILPRLKKKLSTRKNVLEGSAVAPQLDDPSQLAASIERERTQTLPKEPASLRDTRQTLNDEWSNGREWTRVTLDPEALKPLKAARDAASEVLQLAWRRWWLMVSSGFPAKALTFVNTSSTAASLSVVATFGVFAGNSEPLDMCRPFGGIHLMLRDLGLRTSFWLTLKEWNEVEQTLREGVDRRHDWRRGARLERSLSGETVMTVPGQVIWDGWDELDESVRCLALYLISPDPLEELVGDLAEMPQLR